MANNTYVIDVLATGSETVILTDDGTGSDWLTMNGFYQSPTDIRLIWDTDGQGNATSAMGFYFNPLNQGHRLVVNGLIENVRGSNGRDAIIGNHLGNILYGDAAETGAGLSDTIDGDLGHDTIYGGAGADTITGDAGNDSISGNAGNDTISGGAGRDIVIGGLGADSLSGGGDGRDLVSYQGSGAGVTVRLTFGTTTIGIGGDAAGDRINGFNQILGSDFNDVLVDTVKGTVAFGGNDNSFDGGLGSDRLNLGGGKDIGIGGGGFDQLFGEDGNDQLFGNAGNDSLSGGQGADTLTGGQGADLLTGDAGADRFVFVLATDSLAAVTSRDTISDFRHAQGDRIDLHLIDAVPGGANSAFAFRGTAAFTGAGQIRLAIDAGGVTVLGNLDTDAAAEFSIRVDGIAGLTAGDFVL